VWFDHEAQSHAIESSEITAEHYFVMCTSQDDKAAEIRNYSSEATPATQRC
jgi:hypothetical protein